MIEERMKRLREVKKNNILRMKELKRKINKTHLEWEEYHHLKHKYTNRGRNNNHREDGGKK